jgi:hypothetical protein
MPNTRLWLESTTQAKPSTKAHEWSHLKSRNQEPPAQDGLRGLLTNQNAFSCPAVTWRTISHLLFFFQSSPSSPRHDSSWRSDMWFGETISQPENFHHFRELLAGVHLTVSYSDSRQCSWMAPTLSSPNFRTLSPLPNHSTLQASLLCWILLSSTKICSYFSHSKNLCTPHFLCWCVSPLSTESTRLSGRLPWTYLNQALPSFLVRHPILCPQWSVLFLVSSCIIGGRLCWLPLSWSALLTWFPC